MSGAIIVPVIAAAVVADLVEASATSAETAIDLGPRLPLERKAIGYLHGQGIIVEPQPGRYFLIADKVAPFKKSVRTRLLVALGALVAAGAAVFAINA